MRKREKRKRKRLGGGIQLFHLFYHFFRPTKVTMALGTKGHGPRYERKKNARREKIKTWRGVHGKNRRNLIFLNIYGTLQWTYYRIMLRIFPTQKFNIVISLHWGSIRRTDKHTRAGWLDNIYASLISISGAVNIQASCWDLVFYIMLYYFISDFIDFTTKKSLYCIIVRGIT